MIISASAGETSLLAAGLGSLGFSIFTGGGGGGFLISGGVLYFLDRFWLLLPRHIDKTDRQEILTAKIPLFDDDRRQHNHDTVNERRTRAEIGSANHLFTAGCPWV